MSERRETKQRRDAVGCWGGKLGYVKGTSRYRGFNRREAVVFEGRERVHTERKLGKGEAGNGRKTV